MLDTGEAEIALHGSGGEDDMLSTPPSDRMESEASSVSVHWDCDTALAAGANENAEFFADFPIWALFS